MRGPPRLYLTKLFFTLGKCSATPPQEWQFGFWSSLSLELLARAALAHISPTLLAERKSWRNTYHALGHATTMKGFSPSSIATNDVLSILHELLADFTKELDDFCASHCARRNTELHSGEEVFANLGTSVWLPKYYAICGVFLRSMGKRLEDLFDDPQMAEEMIVSLGDSAAKAVAKDVGAYKLVWENKSQNERSAALAQAVAWSTRHAGHRVTCPACGNPSLIHGSGQGPVSTQVSDDVIVQKQTMQPSTFECIACGLKIFGFSKLSACGFGDAYTATTSSSPAEFFGLHTDEELEEAAVKSLESQWEEDFTF